MKIDERFLEALLTELNDTLWTERGLPIRATAKIFNIVKDKTREVEKTINFLAFELVAGDTCGSYPILDLEPIYNFYENNPNMKKVVELILVCAGIPESTTGDIPESIDPIDNRIFYQFVNAAYLAEYGPSHRFDDLLIVYALSENEDADGYANGTFISNNMAKLLGKSEEDLFKLAQINTKYILHPNLITLKKFLYESYRIDGMSTHKARLAAEDAIEKFPESYVVCDKAGTGHFGYNAIMLAENEYLANVAMELDSDLYLFPIDCNHLFVTRAGAMTVKDADTMASLLIDEYLKIQFPLSRAVYHYSIMKNETKLVATGNDIHDITGFLARMKKVK